MRIPFEAKSIMQAILEKQIRDEKSKIRSDKEK